MINISHYKIISIGKIKKKWIQAGIQMYLKRLPGLKIIEIKDSTQEKEESTIKNILKNILNLDLLDFMSLIGCLKNLVMTQEKYNIQV